MPRKLKAVGAPKPSAPRAAPVTLPEIAGWPDTLELVGRGEALSALDHDLPDLAAAPAFRAGNQGVGIDTDRGFTSAGACHRVAAARYLGAPKPDREGDVREPHLMFQAGHLNEEGWKQDLRSWILERGGSILQESDTPITFDIDGVVGTGRPDMVLVDPAGKPAMLYEFKQLASLGSCLEIAFHGPKLDNMAQAARYQVELSRQAGYEVPLEIWYTNRVIQTIATTWGWVAKLLPSSKSPFIEYSPKKQEPTKVPYGRFGFQLRWHNDVLHWRRIDKVRRGGQWTPVTLVTRSGLDDFWRLVRDVTDGVSLGERIKSLAWDGGGTFSACDYCGFRATCDAADQSAKPMATWREGIDEIAARHRADVKAAHALAQKLQKAPK